MKNTIHYFAYGSNLHPVRLIERVPSAVLIGVCELPGFRLTFHKKSNDGSSKCNMFSASKETDVVHGAIYEINNEHKQNLDKFEGKGYGYIDTQISILHDETQYNCFTYIAQQSHIVDNLAPYHWYKNMVILGAKYLNFPTNYVSLIESVISKEDPDEKRRKEKNILLERMTKFR